MAEPGPPPDEDKLPVDIHEDDPPACFGCLRMLVELFTVVVLSLAAVGCLG